MENHHVYNWTVKSGDYQSRSGDYDKLYHEGRKKEKIKRTLIWLCAGFLTYIVFFKVLAYTAAK
jgi:hypothetical protein